MRAPHFALVAAGVLFAAGAAVAGSVWGPPDVGQWIEDTPRRLGQGTYWFGAAMAFLEFSSLLGVILPFEAGVILAGVVAGEGEIALVPLIALVFVATAAGEAIGFGAGRRYGRPFLERRGPRFGVTAARLEQIEAQIERHAGKAVFFGRFIPLVRSTMPFVAGASRLAWRRFLTVALPAALAFAIVFCGVGYLFYESAEHVDEVVDTVGLVALALVTTIVATVLVVRRRRRRARSAGA